MILEAVPKGWFSNDYEVINNGERIVDLHKSWYREQGELTILGEKYQIQKLAMSSTFLLIQNGATVAQAEKPNMFRRTMYIDYNGMRYILERKSVWRQYAFVVKVGDQIIGTIERKNGGWSRIVLVQLPDLPLAIAIFITWIAVILWQRDDAATAATVAVTTG